MEKKMLYVVHVVTKGTVDTESLQDEIAGMEQFPIASVEVVTFRIVKQSKT